MSMFIHDPDAELDYTFDWAEWLGASETITSATITASTGLTVESTNTAPQAVTAWVSTNDTTGRRSLACRITTTAGRIDERTIQINVEER